MDKHERIPIANDLRFIPANEITNSRYNTWPFDNGFFIEQLQNYQSKVLYEQKRNYSDWITIYIDTLATNIIIHLLDEWGEALIAPIDLASDYSAYLPGNTAPNGDPYYTFAYRFRPADIRVMPADTVQEIYHVVIQCVYSEDASEDTYYVSEQLFVRMEQLQHTLGNTTRMVGWEDTQLVECRHDENDYNILFEEIPNLVFRQRVESTVAFDDATMDDTSFEDQEYVTRTLRSVPGRLYKFIVDGVPDYLKDKLNRILSFSTIKIDNVRYTKNSGTKWETKDVTGYPLKSSSIQLQEYAPDSGIEYTGTTDPTTLLTLPVDGEEEIIFPLAWNFLKMFDGISIEDLYPAADFDDSTELLAVLTDIQTTVLPAIGALGNIDVVGNLIVYNNAPGETYSGISDCYVCHKYMHVKLKLGTGVVPYYFQLAGYTTGEYAACVVDWGDGATEWVHGIDGTTTNVPHIYTVVPGDGDKELRIFHRGSDSDFDSTIGKIIFPLDFPAYIRQVYGSPNIEVPPTLGIFEMRSQNLDEVSNVDFSMLAYAADTITAISLRGNGIGGAHAFVPEIFDFDGDPIFTVLEYFDVAYNALTDAQANSLVSSLHAHITASPVKTIRLTQFVPIVYDSTSLDIFDIWDAWGYTIEI